MADETPTTEMVDKPADTAETTTPDGAAADSNDPQAELARMRVALKNANAEAKKHRLEAEERDKARTKAEETALAEQGKYKELFEKQQAALLKAQEEAKSASLRILRREAAEKTGLPLVFADRLQGETLDDLEADAKNIMAALPKPAAPNINNQPGPGAIPGAGMLSEAEVKEKAALYGVKAEYWVHQ